ncbi:MULTISPECIES: hypothetical protein [Corynebacterium]|uniref:Glucose-6-phosphate 1-epimerase n=1 Tax=Corynebacterium lipophilum TaxID=2804918 RepID=A0AAW5HXZ4_9CORY|nr:MULTISPECIES: hypothetical protein [Corynebacterium]MCO6394377.1 hypothetical protein [Corynebacterium lipophilum]MCZ2117906.1 hypothetical protein [Corynebacterium lipophilum]MDK8244862.1 hypothetical protein [Corynebacterium sp. UMB10321]OFT30515.1 hypothetical protein HMPREF3170_04355 [Corynebacterium sp. HMSC08D02]UUA86774.1 hypothetical protein KBP54_08385 [Corynebacterium pseudogenitalium]
MTQPLFFHSQHNPAHGGIPVVAPWFAQTLGEQMHGWATSLEWQHDGDTMRVSHDNFHLVFRSQLDDARSRFELTITNGATTPRPVQIALHPYWACDAATAELSGVQGSRFLDKTDGELKTVEGPLRFGNETDAVIAGATSAVLRDATRELTFTCTGTDHLVVWNPGPDVCRDAEDLGDDDWAHFVCVEPALLGEDRRGVTLIPGASASIALEVAVAALP